jgi:hypothetical protein
VIDSDCPTEHWFDRLTARITRREALKRGAVATALLSLPALRPSPALAADNCAKGCSWTAHQNAGRNLQTCRANYTAANDTSTGIIIQGTFRVGIFAIGAAFLNDSHDLSVFHQCQDFALLTQKAANWDCLKPGCSGFDPMQKGGPCDTCTSSIGSCCVDPTVAQGYSCCTLGCACGGDVGACHGSTTPC